MVATADCRTLADAEVPGIGEEGALLWGVGVELNRISPGEALIVVFFLEGPFSHLPRVFYGSVWNMDSLMSQSTVRRLPLDVTVARRHLSLAAPCDSQTD